MLNCARNTGQVPDNEGVFFLASLQKIFLSPASKFFY